jgi:hypothetical protein
LIFAVTYFYPSNLEERMSMKMAIRLALVTVLLGLGRHAVYSMPDHDEVLTYYSDDTYTDVIGHEYYMCHGTWANGDTSSYVNVTVYYQCSTQTIDENAEGVYSYPYSGRCADNVDNDGDGLVDAVDPDCRVP